MTSIVEVEDQKFQPISPPEPGLYNNNLNSNASRPSSPNTSSTALSTAAPEDPLLDKTQLAKSPALSPIQLSSKAVIYILDIVCSNAQKTYKYVNSKVTPLVKQAPLQTGRVTQGFIQVGSQLAGLAGLSRPAAAGIATVGAVGLGVAGVTTAAIAIWPLLAGLAATSIILKQLSIWHELGIELQELIFTIDIQIQRIHNIYCVMEEISVENKYKLNTEMVKKYLVVLLTNILLSSGRDVYKKLKTSLNNNRFDFSSFDTSVKGAPPPGHQAKLGAVNTFKYMFGYKIAQANRSNLNVTDDEFHEATDEHKNNMINTISHFIDRNTDTKEVIRSILRDLLLLNVNFSILQSEFDLLSRESAELNKQIILKQVEEAEKDPKIETKLNTILSILKTQNTVNKWVSGEIFNTFKEQIPKSNLSISLIEKSTGRNIRELLSTTWPEKMNSSTVVVSNPLQPPKTTLVYKPTVQPASNNGFVPPNSPPPNYRNIDETSAEWETMPEWEKVFSRKIQNAVDKYKQSKKTQANTNAWKTNFISARNVAKTMRKAAKAARAEAQSVSTQGGMYAIKHRHTITSKKRM